MGIYIGSTKSVCLCVCRHDFVRAHFKKLVHGFFFDNLYTLFSLWNFRIFSSVNRLFYCLWNRSFLEWKDLFILKIHEEMRFNNWTRLALKLKAFLTLILNICAYFVLFGREYGMVLCREKTEIPNKLEGLIRHFSYILYWRFPFLLGGVELRPRLIQLISKATYPIKKIVI